MSRTTSAVRLEEALPELQELAPPANTTSAPSPRNRRLLAELRMLSDEDLDTLEDELNFYAFTGMAGPHLKSFLEVIDL